LRLPITPISQFRKVLTFLSKVVGQELKQLKKPVEKDGTILDPTVESFLFLFLFAFLRLLWKKCPILNLIYLLQAQRSHRQVITCSALEELLRRSTFILPQSKTAKISLEMESPSMELLSVLSFKGETDRPTRDSHHASKLMVYLMSSAPHMTLLVSGLLIRPLLSHL